MDKKGKILSPVGAFDLLKFYKKFKQRRHIEEWYRP